MVGKITIHQCRLIKGIFSNLRMQSYSCRGISNALTSPLLSCSFLFSSFFSHIIPVADVSGSLRGVVLVIDGFHKTQLSPPCFVLLSAVKVKVTPVQLHLIVSHVSLVHICGVNQLFLHFSALHIALSSATYATVQRLHLLLWNNPPLYGKRCDERRAPLGPDDERRGDLAALRSCSCWLQKGRLQGSQEGVNQLWLKPPC